MNKLLYEVNVLLTQHNISFVILKFFIQEDESIDGDNPDHIKWIYDRALERAQEYNISGVTYQLTQGKLCSCIF